MTANTIPPPSKQIINDHNLVFNERESFPLTFTQEGIRTLRELFREKGVSEEEIEKCFPPKQIRKIRFKRKK